jgi:hypothetical protein
MSADLNIEKSAPLFWVGEHAGVVFAEDAVTVLCDEAVDEIAKRAGNDSRQGS